jgi:hypothetical protein
MAMVEAKAHETAETKAERDRLSWDETRSELRKLWGLARQETVGSPPSTVHARRRRRPIAAAAAATTAARTDPLLTERQWIV